MNPNPRDRPDSLSLITIASSTDPNSWNADRSDSSSVAHASPPMYTILLVLSHAGRHTFLWP